MKCYEWYSNNDRFIMSYYELLFIMIYYENDLLKPDRMNRVYVDYVLNSIQL